jgi:serine/threonine protein kinase
MSEITVFKPTYKECWEKVAVILRKSELFNSVVLKEDGSGLIVEGEEMIYVGGGGDNLVYRAHGADGRYYAVGIPRLDDDYYDIDGNSVYSEFLKELDEPLPTSLPKTFLIYDFAKNKSIFIMEYCEEKSLFIKSLEDFRETQNILKNPGTLVNILEVLLCLKKHNIVYFDLEPGNILLRANGTVTMVNFGLMRKNPSAGIKIKGKPLLRGLGSFMAPEVIDSTKGYFERTDLWSLGVILYWVLTGKSLFSTSMENYGPVKPEIEKEISDKLSRAVDIYASDNLGDGGQMRKNLIALTESFLVVDFYKRSTVEEALKLTREMKNDYDRFTKQRDREKFNFAPSREKELELNRKEEENKKLEEENKGLEEENKRLEEKSKGLEEENKRLKEEKRKKLEEENKRLKEENRKQKEERKELEEERKRLEEERKELEEEEKQLKNALQTFDDKFDKENKKNTCNIL